MPWVLSYSASAFGYVLGLVMACRYCRAIADRLLDMDFAGYVQGVCEYVVISVLNAV